MANRRKRAAAKGRELVLDIARMGHRGEGVAEVDGEPLYVPFTLPGEKVRVHAEGRRGTLVSVLEQAPERVTPLCPHFGRCGGCQLQHWRAEPYQAFKRALVETALARAGIDVPVGGLVDARGEGRRRVTLHAQREIVGFNAPRSHQVIDIDNCPILVPSLKRAPDIARACRDVVGAAEVAVTATLFGPDVSVTAKARGAELALGALAPRFELSRIALNGEELVVPAPPEVLMGRARVRLPIGSFLQATAAAETALAERVLAATAGAREVADLFCGLGPFALRIAEHARVLAADSDARAIAALTRAWQTTSGLKTIKAVARDLFQEPMSAAELAAFDAVVFDPPRVGAAAQAGELAQSRVPMVVAVSCDPVSFARDAATLVAGGYTLGEVTPFDQFAWSAHVETVGVFRR